MLLDGLSSSHPISQEVERATDIDRVFDWIAYKKVRELASKIAANISISLGAKWKWQNYIWRHSLNIPKCVSVLGGSVDPDAS